MTFDEYWETCFEPNFSKHQQYEKPLCRDMCKIAFDLGVMSGFDDGQKAGFQAKFESSDKTLRDEFAMAAMGVFIQGGYELMKNELAELAYEIADAMLKEREK